MFKDNLVYLLMFFIYSLTLENLQVKLYDFCRTKDGIDELLDTVARNFIRHEEGERRAESAYRDGIPDSQITEDGYFLRHSAEKPHQIDLFQRKTLFWQGRVWNSYEITCNKIMHFSVTEAALGLPIDCTGRGTTTQKFNSAFEAQQQADHIEQLKERLVEQRKKVDRQLEGYPSCTEKLFSSQDEDESEDEYEIHEGPLSILRKRLDGNMTSLDARIAETERLLESLELPVSCSSIPTPPPLPIWTSSSTEW